MIMRGFSETTLVLMLYKDFFERLGQKISFYISI